VQVFNGSAASTTHDPLLVAGLAFFNTVGGALSAPSWIAIPALAVLAALTGFLEYLLPDGRKLFGLAATPRVTRTVAAVAALVGLALVVA
jgi:hypothetical protein